MLPHIIPYNKANVAKDQPWLSDVDPNYLDMLDIFGYNTDIEPCVLQDLITRADEGDQYAYQQIYPLSHFILTTDYRIVQEPNVLRWGVFLEKAEHRSIDITTISVGRDHKHGTPSFKTEYVCVSTVFIGASENELFETRIFGGPLDGACWRHKTLIDSKTKHWKIVQTVRSLNRHMKRHGKSFRKDWLRLQKVHRLASIRGFGWLSKHVDVLENLYIRLGRVPGRPQVPQPNIMRTMIQIFIPRESL
jgi:hypothetical protein